MDFGKPVGNADFAAIETFKSMTQMLGKQHAIFGPNPDDIKELETLKAAISLANTQASGLKAFIVGESSAQEKALAEAEDGPELLEITAGMIHGLNVRLKENARVISSKPFSAGEIKQINKDVTALNNILTKSYDALMELRQSILAKKGLAPHFRATRANLEKVAIEASRTDAGAQDFVEV